MQDSQNSHEKVPNTSRSEMDEESPISRKQEGNYFNKICRNMSVGLILLLLLIMSVGYWNQNPLETTEWVKLVTPIKFDKVDFDFHVYCPISYTPNLPDGLKKAMPFLNQSYVVSAQMHEDENGNQSYYYCGLTRTWEGSCEEATFVCTKPGPAFDFHAEEEVFVTWIN